VAASWPLIRNMSFKPGPARRIGRRVRPVFFRPHELACLPTSFHTLLYLVVGPMDQPKPYSRTWRAPGKGVVTASGCPQDQHGAQS
jgi:hypothetical protein